jgi:hypothetical protein
MIQEHLLRVNADICHLLSLRYPKRLIASDKLNRHFGRERFDPLGHLQHSLFFRDIVAKHDPALWQFQRCCIEDIRGAVEKAIRLLLLSADHHVYVWAVDARSCLQLSEPGRRGAFDR